MKGSLKNIMIRYRAVYPFLGSGFGMSMLYYCIFQTQLPGLSIGYFINNFQAFSIDWQIIAVSTIPCYFLLLAMSSAWLGWQLGRACSVKMSDKPAYHQYASNNNKGR